MFLQNPVNVHVLPFTLSQSHDCYRTKKYVLLNIHGLLLIYDKFLQEKICLVIENSTNVSKGISRKIVLKLILSLLNSIAESILRVTVHFVKVQNWAQSLNASCP